MTITQGDQVSQNPYRAVFESAPDGILVVDGRGLITEANAEAHDLFGYGPGELEGVRVDRLVPESARDRHQGHRERYTDSPVSRPMGVGMELEAARRDGSTFPVEISLSPIGEGKERRVIATVRDLSLRKRLRDFGAGAMRASEDVRTLIARELHDQTAQELATHLVRLRLLERATDPEDRARQIAHLRDGLEQTAEGVRRVARGLRPPELEDAGLLVALQAHARSVEETRGTRVEIRPFVGIDDALTPDGLLAVYRIVQEAVTNAARHGRAEHVEVEVERLDEEIAVRIEDDGRGFEPERIEREGRGLGLLGMRERAAILGGRFSISSRPGEGTRVDVVVPIQIQREAGHVG